MIEPLKNQEIDKGGVSASANSDRSLEATTTTSPLFFCSLVLRSFAGFILNFVLLIFIGALFWAKGQDPFVRKWASLESGGVAPVQCVAVLPKPVRPYPVVIYVHDSGGSLMTDGIALRRIAELGLAVVSLEYNQTNDATFTAEFERLQKYIASQYWANTNTTAWIGSGRGANRLLDLALSHPETQPQVFIQLGPAYLSLNQTNRSLKSLRCRVLLVRGDQDKKSELADTTCLASTLQAGGVDCKMKVIPDVSLGDETDYELISRYAGEYCLTYLSGDRAFSNYESINQWQQRALQIWWFWLPAAIWVIVWFVWVRPPMAAPIEKLKLKTAEIAVRWLAVVLAICALTEIVIRVFTPCFSANSVTIEVARLFLVSPSEREDFEFLLCQPISRGKLKPLLENVRLSNYNRQIVNWSVDEQSYRAYVLSSRITDSVEEQFGWRRFLWEELYPRIRQEQSPQEAARIVASHLRARVTVISETELPHEVQAIWLKQITDEAGFEILYVAALRSVGIPARLNTNARADIFVDGKWLTAPQPLIMTW